MSADNDSISLTHYGRRRPNEDMDRGVQTLYNPPCICPTSADVRCLWCPEVGTHPGRWCTCQMQWILYYPSLVPGYQEPISGLAGICVGCLMYEVDSISTERQRLDRLTDLFDRQTVSVMRQMGAWTRPGEERSTRNVEQELVADTTTTIEAEMHGIIALSSSVDDRFRDGARIIRPTTGTHRIRPVDDSRRDTTSVIYRVEPYDSDIGHVIGGGFRRRDT